jgi:hypothetical protein
MAIASPLKQTSEVFACHTLILSLERVGFLFLRLFIPRVYTYVYTYVV